MIKYFRVSLFIALALSVTYIVLMQQNFSAAHDGSGPDGNALIAFFVSIIAIGSLIHAAIISVILFEKNKSESKKGLAIIALGALLVGFPYLKSQASSAYSTYQYNSTPYAKLMNAIDNKQSAPNILSKLDSVGQKEKNYVFYNDLIFQLCAAGRVDVLKVFEATGVATANDKDIKTWVACIHGLVSRETLTAAERLSVAKWVFEKTIADKSFLKSATSNIFDVNSFFDTFKDLKNPDVIQLFDLLVRHGADLNTGDSIPLLWYAARFKYFEHVRFLVENKADLNTLENDTTALDQALENNDQAIIDLLRKAGAKKANQLRKN